MNTLPFFLSITDGVVEVLLVPSEIGESVVSIGGALSVDGLLSSESRF